jgi:hypothetical protein
MCSAYKNTSKDEIKILIEKSGGVGGIKNIE